MKKLFASLSLILMLTACGPASVEDLMEDPKLLGEVMEECMVKMAQGKDADDQECKNAVEAQKKMTRNMMQGLMR